MNILKRLVAPFTRSREKDVSGGFELLRSLFGAQYTQSKMLEQYEKSLYVFACVSKLAEKVASIDFSLYQILNSSGDTKELVLHPALDLLYRVNPFQTRSEFIKITVINLRLAGDAFWYKVRNNSGQVVELWNLRPDYVEIIKDPTQFVRGYRFSKSNGETVFFAPEDIVHFKSPTPLDEYYGTSPVKSAQIRIQTEELASTYQRDFFLNNARPDALLKFPTSLHASQKNEIREQFEDRHKGRGKNSKIAIFENGLEYQQISISQREMDYIESMRFTRDDILVAFHTPKTIVAITDDVNRANADAAMYVYLSETVKPFVTMMTEIINEMLIIPDFGQNLFLGFTDPTPENREQVIKEYESGINANWLLRNEVRAKENLPPMDGGWDWYLPLSSVPIGGITGKSLNNQSLRIGGLSKAEITKKLVEIEQEKAVKNRQKKMKVFRGRESLYQRFVVAEEFVKEARDEVKRLLAMEAKEAKPLINKELRDKYATMVNKQIDTRAERLKENVVRVANSQRDRLMLMLQGIGDLTKAVGRQTKKDINQFYKDEEPVMAEFILPFIQDYAREAGIEAMALVDPNLTFDYNEALRKSLEKRAKEFSLSVNETTREKVVKAISDGLDNGEGITAIGDRVDGVYSEFGTYRADLIARTESTAASNEGFISAYQQSNVVTHKEWIATLDDRTREEHVALDGEIVPVDSTFSNGLEYPQEPNCRCVIAPAFED